MKKTLLFLAMLLITMGASSQQKKAVTEFEALKPLVKQPKVGEWYKVNVEGCVNSDGSTWVGAYRKGTSNNVLILFYGGGASFDEYTATRGLTQCAKMSEMFYNDKLKSPLYAQAIPMLNKSIASTGENNPFRDWTFVVLPYTTGDFHCGTGDFKYKGADGKEHVLYHHGYTNCMKFMEKIVPMLGKPDALLITGFSAGGFGTAILSDDVISFFPETKNVTICADAACARSDNWKRYAKEVWGAPDHICERLESEYITLDCLRALHEKRPEVKILFGISPYDETLASFQPYLDKEERRPLDREVVDIWHGYLVKFCEEFRATIPEGGLFIWNDFVTDENSGATMHTIEYSDAIFRNLGGHGSFIQWMYDGYKGEVRSYGLELVQ